MLIAYFALRIWGPVLLCCFDAKVVSHESRAHSFIPVLLCCRAPSLIAMLLWCCSPSLIEFHTLC